MVSMSLFKCTFAGSAVYFSMIVSKIWCNFCFVYYVPNLALVGKGTIRFIYTITVYCLYFIFCDYFFIMHSGNWFNICHAAITYFHIAFVEYFIIFMFWNCFWIKYRKYLPMLLEKHVEPDDVSLTMIYVCFHFHYLVVWIEVCSHTQIDLRYFDTV